MPRTRYVIELTGLGEYMKLVEAKGKDDKANVQLVSSLTKLARENLSVEAAQNRAAESGQRLSLMRERVAQQTARTLTEEAKLGAVLDRGAVSRSRATEAETRAAIARERLTRETANALAAELRLATQTEAGERRALAAVDRAEREKVQARERAAAEMQRLGRQQAAAEIEDARRTSAQRLEIDRAFYEARRRMTADAATRAAAAREYDSWFGSPATRRAENAFLAPYAAAETRAQMQARASAQARGRVYASVAGGAGNVAMGIAGIGLMAAREAAQYEKALQDIRGNTTMTDAEFRDMAAIDQKLAVDWGTTLTHVAEGYMHAINLHYQGADAIRVTTEATKAAVAAHADEATTVDLVAKVMRAYNLEASQATRIVNLLWYAAANSDAKMKDLVNSGGRAFAIAAGMGIGPEQTAAMLSGMMASPLTASLSTTQAVGEINKIVNPSKGTKDLLSAVSKRTGVDLLGDFSMRGLQSKGLGGWADDMRTAAERLQIPIAELTNKLFPNMRGQLAALMGTSDSGVKGYNERMADAERIAKGWNPVQEGLNRQLGTAANEFARLANEIRVGFLPAGRDVLKDLHDILPAFRDAAHGVEGLMHVFTLLPEAAQVAVLAFGAVGLAGKLLGISLLSPLALLRDIKAGFLGLPVAGAAGEGAAAGGIGLGALGLMAAGPMALGVGGYMLHRQSDAEWQAYLKTPEGKAFLARSYSTGSTTRHFTDPGAAIPAGLQGVHPGLAQAAAALVAASGGRVGIASGRRSAETQADLYRAWLSGKSRYPAAAPGHSAHQTGDAVDFSGDLALAHKLGPQFGIHFPVAGDPVHGVLAGGSTSGLKAFDALTNDPLGKKAAAAARKAAAAARKAQRERDAALRLGGSDATGSIRMDLADLQRRRSKLLKDMNDDPSSVSAGEIAAIDGQVNRTRRQLAQMEAHQYQVLKQPLKAREALALGQDDLVDSEADAKRYAVARAKLAKEAADSDYKWAQESYALGDPRRNRAAEAAQRAAVAYARADEDAQGLIDAKRAGPLHEYHKEREAEIRKIVGDLGLGAGLFGIGGMIGGTSDRVAREISRRAGLAQPFGPGGELSMKEMEAAQLSAQADKLAALGGDPEKVKELRDHIEELNGEVVRLRKSMADSADDLSLRRLGQRYGDARTEIDRRFNLHGPRTEAEKIADTTAKLQAIVANDQAELAELRSQVIGLPTSGQTSAIGEVMRRLKGDQSALSDFPVLTAIEKRNKWMSEMQGDLTGAGMSLFHGDKAGNIATNFGKTVMERYQQEFLKGFFDKLFHKKDPMVDALDKNRASIDANTRAHGGDAPGMPGPGGKDKDKAVGVTLMGVSDIFTGKSATRTAFSSGGALSDTGFFGPNGPVMTAANSGRSSDGGSGGGTGKAAPWGTAQTVGAVGAGIGVFQQGQQQGVNVGNLLGAAATGFAVGGPIGAGVGVGLDLLGGLFHHKSDQYTNPALYNAPGQFEYDMYRSELARDLRHYPYGTAIRYNAARAGAGSAGVTRALNVNLYTDGVKTAVHSALLDDLSPANLSLSSVYFDPHGPIG